MTKDQRHMLPGASEAQNADDIRQVWVNVLGDPRRPNRQQPVPDGRTVTPYINQGRWVADCPNCGSGIACWDRNPEACCLGNRCGHVYTVAWQPAAVRAEVERVLAVRLEDHQNWEAQRGETVEELKIENVLQLGVPHTERPSLLRAEGIDVPSEFPSPIEYLNSLRKKRRT